MELYNTKKRTKTPLGETAQVWRFLIPPIS